MIIGPDRLVDLLVDEEPFLALQCCSPRFGSARCGTHINRDAAFKELWDTFARYFDSGNLEGRASIAVYHPEFALRDLQRIAQAVLHFENALQKSISDIFAASRQLCRDEPDIRRIGADNPHLQHLPRTEMIQRVGATRTVDELEELVNPPHVHDGWFLDCRRDNINDGVLGVTFKWWPHLLSPEDQKKKVNNVVHFVTACISCPHPVFLQQFPVTLEGLQRFARHCVWISRGEENYSVCSRFPPSSAGRTR